MNIYFAYHFISDLGNFTRVLCFEFYSGSQCHRRRVRSLGRCVTGFAATPRHRKQTRRICFSQNTTIFRDDPTSFFIVVKASFRKSQIAFQLTKAQHLVASLDRDLISHIKDIAIIDTLPHTVYDRVRWLLRCSFKERSSRTTALTRSGHFGNGKR